ncbi:helix-turn-helix transcriptional regulator [Pedobacter frigoris]|uniref:AraC family transcriptional regulator n=1 Tax=Pedobacter frigoris TaxID=2571272 RepID=UPI00292DD46E|nr:helix-turn-helix transcriptional regulator [Pedobacter frigoris]
MNQPAAEYIHSVLPFHKLFGRKLIDVCRFDSISQYYSYEPHRHAFDVVVWATKGRGVQSIDHIDYDLLPGRLFFVRSGQLHQIKQYAEDGWMILLNEEALRNLNDTLLNNFYRQPYLDLKELSCETFMGLFSLLQLEARQLNPNAMMITNLLNGMLLCAEQCNPFIGTVGNLDRRFSVVKKLKSLIEREYKKHKDPDYYYDAIGLPGRRVNNITKPLLGKTVYELLQDRLLLESKSLLSETTLTVKEIAVELEFNSQGYFCRFFKKMTGITALDYRTSYHSTSV